MSNTVGLSIHGRGYSTSLLHCLTKYCNDYITIEKRITHYSNETIKYKLGCGFQVRKLIADPATKKAGSLLHFFRTRA
jgi:hypothetical protein